jgi:hypothetical protein
VADQHQVPGWRLGLEALRRRLLVLVVLAMLAEPTALVGLKVMVLHLGLHRLAADRIDLGFVGCLLGA